MSYPLREYLEVYTQSTEKWVRCTKCLHALCCLDEDWKRGCTRKKFPPTNAGPLMNILVGRYVLQKLYCPSCGVLFDSDMVEENPQDEGNESGGEL